MNSIPIGLEPKTDLEKLLWKLVQSQAAENDLLKNQLALQHEATTTSSPHLEESEPIKVEEAGQIKLPSEGRDYSKGVDEDELLNESPQSVPCDVTFPQSHESVKDPFWEFIVSKWEINSFFVLQELTKLFKGNFKIKPTLLKCITNLSRKILHHNYHMCLMADERKMFLKGGK